jgi:membrane protein YdbS with pleckstrin-like domain
MRKFIVNNWNAIMDAEVNPLRHIKDLQTRHVVMQLLAWMWCIIFAMSVGSVTVFGISAVAHALLIAGIVVTVATFETAKRKPQVFNRYKYGVNYSGRGNGGEHE